MQKRLLFAIGLIICGFSVVALVNVFQLTRVSSILHQTATVDAKFFATAVKLQAAAAKADHLALETFVETDPDRAQALRTELTTAIEDVNKNLATLKSNQFEDLHRIPVLNATKSEVANTSNDASPDDSLKPIDSGSKSAENEQSGAPKGQESQPTLVVLIDSLTEILKRMGEESQLVSGENFDRLTIRKNLYEERTNLSAAFREALFLGRRTGAEDMDQYNALSRAVMVTLYSDSVRDLKFLGNGKFNQAKEFFTSRPMKVGDKKIFDEFNVQFEKTYEQAARWAANTADVSFGKYSSVYSEFKSGLNDLMLTTQAAIDANQEDSIATANSIRLITIVLSLAVMVFGIAYAITMSRNLVSKLMELLSTVKSRTDEVSIVADSLKKSANRLSETTTLQAAAIQQTSSSMEEMGAMLQNTSEQVQQSESETKVGERKSDEAKHIMNSLVGNMTMLEEASQNLAGVVSAIVEIQQKTKVINDIVFETKLLSFNASIEAARAGSHGRGFAVVAEEVGKLAVMSGKAADEINKLLAASLTRVQDSVSSAQDNIRTGNSIVLQCERSFLDLGRSMRSISENVATISKASVEQGRAVQESNRYMREMESNTSENAESAKQLSGFSNQLDNECAALGSALGGLENLVKSSGRTTGGLNITHDVAQSLNLIRDASLKTIASVRERVILLRQKRIPTTSKIEIKDGASDLQPEPSTIVEAKSRQSGRKGSKKRAQDSSGFDKAS
jgi:methyl-accepting chemotaxis protein